MKVGDNFLCKICGNKVELKEVGGGQLVCCGALMEKV
jgi:desulfoferrodoxin-like iron-binding protein